MKCISFYRNRDIYTLILSLVLFLFNFLFSQSANEIKNELRKVGLSVDEAKKIAIDSGLIEKDSNPNFKDNNSSLKTNKEDLLNDLSEKALLEKNVNDQVSRDVNEDEDLINEFVVLEESVIQNNDNDPSKNFNNYFGYNIFYNDPEVFQNSFSDAIDPNYVVGPGDEVVIMLWGDTELNNSYTVSSEGYLFIEDIGQVFVNGLKMTLLEKKLIKLLTKVYASLGPENGPATTFFDASLGSSVLRPLRIFCVGEIEKPGAYNVKNSSTVFTSLYYFNGPTIDGSLREIKLIRNEKEIANIDFYDFLLYGRKNNDIQIINDDIIFIPPRVKTVNVKGEINRPLIYELKKDEGLISLINIAGGLSATTDINIVQVERILPYKERSFDGVDRILIDVKLDELLEGEDDFLLNDRDIITFFKIGENVGNSITINGSVNRPGNYGYFNGMLLTDLIQKADGLASNAYYDKADIVRLNENLDEEHLDVNLFRAMNGNTLDNIKLSSGDVVQIYSNLQMKYSTDVAISGHVISPGIKPYREGMTIYDLIFLGGGFENELHIKNAFLDRGDLIRLSEKDFTKELINFSLKDVLIGEGMATFKLKMGDEIKLYSLEDIYGKDENTVTIAGQIKNPGTYSLYKNYKIYDYIFLAGGFLDKNFDKNIYKERVDIVRNVDFGKNKNIITINLKSILDDSSSANNIYLKNGDLIRFYSKLDINTEDLVEISGIVNKPGKYELKNKMNFKDLMFEAGGLKENGSRFIVEISRTENQEKTENFSIIGSFTIDKSFNLVGLGNLKDNFTDKFKNIALKPYDYIVVRPNPYFSRQHKVVLSGLVYYPGVYALSGPNNKVSEVISRAGGLRPEAYPRSSSFIRDNTNINLSFEELIKNPKSKYNFNLVDGDSIIIGSKSNTILISGAVNAPGSYQYIRGSRLKKYIELAGGYTKQASKYSSYITYPDGKSKPIKFLRSSPKVIDGTVIYIGTKDEVEKFSFTEYVTNLTSIWADLTQAYLMIMLMSNNQSN